MRDPHEQISGAPMGFAGAAKRRSPALGRAPGVLAWGRGNTPAPHCRTGRGRETTPSCRGPCSGLPGEARAHEPLGVTVDELHVAADAAGRVGLGKSTDTAVEVA